MLSINNLTLLGHKRAIKMILEKIFNLYPK